MSEHAAWRPADGADFLEPAAAIAERLAVLSGRAERVLHDDPWLDADLADRFTKRTDWLVHRRSRTRSGTSHRQKRRC